MGIVYSLEAQVIISPKTICTSGSQLILCSQKIHSCCHSHCFAVAFSTLMLFVFSHSSCVTIICTTQCFDSLFYANDSEPPLFP